PATTQLPDQRRANPAPHPGRRVGAEPGATTDDRTEQRGSPARLDEVARVVVGDPRYVPLVDAEEPAGRVHRRLWLVDDLAVADHQDPVRVDVAAQVRDLLAVQPEVAVAPERRPAGGGPRVL